MPRSNDALPRDAADLLRFWFNELNPEQWWKRDPTVDAAIAERFAALHERLAKGLPDDWLETPRGTLAAIIALDQLPRNLFRNDRRAYATDAKALAIAQGAVAKGFDKQLSQIERGFIYMPFQHSEDKDVQARSVELFASNGDAKGIDYATKHKEIVDRFGRFPHRNDVLGRTSTPEEIEFLEGPALFW